MFYKKLVKRRSDSRLIFRLDISLPVHYEEDRETLTEIAFRLCDSVEDYVAAMGIDSPFFASAGAVNSANLVNKFKVPFIADFNLAETEGASLWIAEHAFNAGFEALVVHGFMGEEYLKTLKEFAQPREIIPIVGMEYSSAHQFLNPHTPEICEAVERLGLKTVIAPSTLEGVKKIRKLLGDEVLILVDSEGGSIGDYVNAGADFEMVSRDIHVSKDPEEKALSLMEALRESEKKT